MTAVGARRCAATAAVLAVAVSLLGGCVVQDERPMERISATKATVEVPEAELLDVGIRVFDPNIPESTEEQEKKRVFPDVRKAESRYMPVVLRDTLEGTGQWGQVRVMPANGTGMDLFVDGKILESTGRELRLAITAVDATGRVWLPIGLHLAWNFTQGGIFGVAVSGTNLAPGLLVSRFSGPEWLSGGLFGAEASIVSVVVCLAGAAYFLWRVRRERPRTATDVQR